MKVTSSQVLGTRSWTSLGGHYHAYLGFPGGDVVKNLPNNAGDTGAAGSILGLGRAPGEGNGNAPPYSCLENAMDRGAWRAAVHGFAKGWDMTERALMHAILHTTHSLLLWPVEENYSWDSFHSWCPSHQLIPHCGPRIFQAPHGASP